MDDAENRVPYQLIHSGEELQCDWINTLDKRFTEPFFDDTYFSLRILDQKNRTQRYISALAEMQQKGGRLDSVTPAVFIFHLSRCGSTLVSQLFATSGRFIVLSEVPFFDELLQLPLSVPGFDEADIPGLFSSALNYYGRKRFAAEEHMIIKTDCWHIFFYDTLRKMFPQTPFVLMYRSPDEVLASLLKLAGRQTVPELVDPRMFGLPGMPEVYQREIYTATILEKLLTKFLEVAEKDKNCLPVNYNEGALTVVKKIAALANIELSGEETGIMEQRSHYHSKNPGELFSEEPAADVPECLLKAMRLYEALEQKRKMTQMARERSFPPAG